MSQKRAERLQLMLTLDEVKKVEEWRFEKRMPSRSAAVRALMNIGLNSGIVMNRRGLEEGAISSADVGILRDESVQGGKPSATADRPKILVVEGDFLVARGIKDVLEGSGFAVVGPASGWDEAEPHLKSARIAAAVLGLQSDHPTLEHIVDRLREKDVPMLFCLAADPKECLPEPLWSEPVVSRVSARETLGPAVERLVAKIG
jgi:hypothetical protein